MKKENDELINLFRSRLEHVGMPVRANLWDDLEKDIPVVLHRRRRLLHRFAGAASILLILAGASAAFWHFSPKEEIADAFTQVAASTVSTGKMGVDVVKEEFPSIQAAPILPKATANNYVYYIDEEEDDSVSFSFSMSFSFSASDTDDGDISYAGGLEKRSGYAENVNEHTSVAPAVCEKKKKWSTQIYASTNVFTAQKKGSLNDITQQYTNVKYKLPLSIGLTVQKELSGWFALETGLVYTLLNSELTTGKGTYYQQNQTLHYLGIPVKGNFNLADSKRFNLYASAGGMIEKCIAGNVKTDDYVDGSKTHSSKNSLRPDPLQLSLSAAIGLQYKFNDRLSMYAEPGLVYYFDDGSSVSTIRKEKPLNLNLLCGVRMTY